MAAYHNIRDSNISRYSRLSHNHLLCKLQKAELYSNYLERKLILRCFAVLLLFSFQNAIGEETFNRDNSLKSQLIQLAYTTTILACEDPSREYYKRLLKILIGAGKKYNELTDSEISVLREKTAKFRIDCHRDVIENNSYRNDMLIKIYCYEAYLNRFDNVDTYMTKVKFFDESGNSSEYIRDITKKIELDAKYSLKAAECFKGIL